MRTVLLSAPSLLPPVCTPEKPADGFRNTPYFTGPSESHQRRVVPHAQLLLPVVSPPLQPGMSHPNTACPGPSAQSPPTLTLAGDVHAEVHAIDEVDIQGARLHEHATVAGSLPATPRVGSLVLWPQVGLCLHDAATQLCAITEPPYQDLQAVGLLRQAASG